MDTIELIKESRKSWMPRRMRPLKTSEKAAAWVVAGVGVAMLGTWALRRATRARPFQNLAGKRVLIMGGSRGLGLVMARELVVEGCSVAITARSAEELQRAEEELGQFHQPLMSVVCDVRHEESVNQAVKEVMTEWGGVDVLINNAGIIQKGPAEEMTIEDYREAIETHYWGPLYATLAVLPFMKRRGRGAIINIASIGGKISMPHLLPYNASKFALVGLSEGLHYELAKDNIQVLTVCPGVMRTGSPIRAYFKGQHRKEFRFFNIMSSMPIFSIGARRAARQIIRALKRGDSEVVLSFPAKIAARLFPLFPELTATALRWVATLMPEPGGIGQERMEGRFSCSALSPSILTTLSDRAATENNER